MQLMPIFTNRDWNFRVLTIIRKPIELAAKYTRRRGKYQLLNGLFFEQNKRNLLKI